MPAAPDHTENDLLLRVSAGDEAAFRRLFYAYHNKLGAYVLGWTRSFQIAEDIVQDVFLKIWANRKALAGIEKFDSYLFIISRNHTFNVLKSMARERARRQSLESTEAESFFEQEDNSLLSRYKPLIETAVARLPEQQRKVYLLKYHERLKYQEIGDRLGISPETARKHLAAAIRSVSTFLKTHPGIVLLMTTTPLLIK